MEYILVSLLLLLLRTSTQGFQCLNDVDPCVNGGNCTSQSNGTGLCVCVSNYTGERCEHWDRCLASRCLNGGSCSHSSQSQNTSVSYTCSCPPNVTGQHCETLVTDPCLSNPCLNSATCQRSSSTHYTCICQNGWIGPRCQQADLCSGSPCRHGARCLPSGGHFRCLCRPGYRGQVCDIDVDECQARPCLNGGTCLNLPGSYSCVCPLTHSGPACQETTGACVPGICQHGGTCLQDTDPTIVSHCVCPAGHQCELNNSCLHNPCHNGAICDPNPITGQAICHCPQGYTGPVCQHDMNECSMEANPCEHSGRCENTPGSFRCRCWAGYTGARCELDIKECLSNPCLNGATCLDKIGEFECICMSGYEGIFCEINRDECLSNPCLNQGVCQDRINDVLCECAPGFQGLRCQEDMDKCRSDPCLNGGMCVDEPGGFHCLCQEGYEASLCEVDIDDCAGNPCHHGTCLDGVASYTCVCVEGYTGRVCSQEVNECASQPCQHSAACQGLLNTYQCLCPPGTTGSRCETLIAPCAGSPCMNGGSCIEAEDNTSFACVCPRGSRGQLCESWQDVCSTEPCFNGGKCVSAGPDFNCSCPANYTGKNCETYRDLCTPNPCQNGGTCREVPGIGEGRCNHTESECVGDNNLYTCLCPHDVTGARCEEQISSCTHSSCMNGGTRVLGLAHACCVCTAGFTGDWCEAEVSECEEGPCLNGGTCLPSPKSYSCVCPQGYTGSKCQIETDACSVAVCKNGGVCEPIASSFLCRCPTAWTGSYCEEPRSLCERAALERGVSVEGLCMNGGWCEDNGLSHTCRCARDYTGEACEDTLKQCQLNPCYHTATCIDLATTYFCQCAPGYSGRNCSVEEDECESQPCLNGGSCVNMVNGFRCVCLRGSQGPRCQHDPDDCLAPPSPSGPLHSHPSSHSSSQPKCYNGGQCVDGLGGYTCHCQAGFVGSHCEGDVDECLSNPCHHPGTETCQQLRNAYQCVCKRQYTGQLCESVIDSCQSSPCQNGGTCVVGLDIALGFLCECPPEYSGEACEVLLLCPSRPCLNRGLCLAGRCSCPRGFGGPDCRIPRLDGCHGGPCWHGGTCETLAQPPHYTCHCRPGFTGRHCQDTELQMEQCGEPGGCVATSTPNPMPPHTTCDPDGEQSCALDPWALCPISPRCRQNFRNGVCDLDCNTLHCLFDGFDCQDNKGPCNPGYGLYCQHHYNDGHCDHGCGSAVCGWDGEDCRPPRSQDLASDILLLMAFLTPENIRDVLSGFMWNLGVVLHSTVRVKRSESGQVMVYPYHGREDLDKLHALVYNLSSPARHLFKRELGNVTETEGNPERKVIGSIIFVEVITQPCLETYTSCFPSASDAASFFAALLETGDLDFPFPLEAVAVIHDEARPQVLWWPLVCVSLAAVAALCLGVLAGVRLTRRRERGRRRNHGQLWLPPGFNPSKQPRNYSRREPVGQDSIGMRILNAETDCEDEEVVQEMSKAVHSHRSAKRGERLMVADHGQRIHKQAKTVDCTQSIALTPLQKNHKTLNVDTRGPDKVTPLMLMACGQRELKESCGVDTEPGAWPGESSVGVLGELLSQGEGLESRTELMGETALHLACRFSQAGVAHHLLGLGADINSRDNWGRTALHSAVGADALHICQILISNRLTELDARSQDGTTPLALAVRLEHSEIVEELVKCGADVNATDKQGKSSLHWAAAVDNAEAAQSLMQRGANPNLQDLKGETPLFTAAREGSLETARRLLSYTANKELPDHLGRTPANVAAERAHHDLEQLLLQVHNPEQAAARTFPCPHIPTPAPGLKPPLSGRRSEAKVSGQQEIQSLSSQAHLDLIDTRCLPQAHVPAYLSPTYCQAYHGLVNTGHLPPGSGQGEENRMMDRPSGLGRSVLEGAKWGVGGRQRAETHSCAWHPEIWHPLQVPSPYPLCALSQLPSHLSLAGEGVNAAGLYPTPHAYHTSIDTELPPHCLLPTVTTQLPDQRSSSNQSVWSTGVPSPGS